MEVKQIEKVLAFRNFTTSAQALFSKIPLL